MPDKTKKQIQKTQWRMNYFGSAWTADVLQLAHAILRTYGRVAIKWSSAPGKEPIEVEFRTHPALDAWSNAQLKPQK